jgi:hypothetical protein
MANVAYNPFCFLKHFIFPRAGIKQSLVSSQRLTFGDNSSWGSGSGFVQALLIVRFSNDIDISPQNLKNVCLSVICVTVFSV